MLNDFAKGNDKIVLRAGSYAGKTLDKAGMQALASIPSREELLARLLGVMQAPVSGIAGALAALAKEARGKKALPPDRSLPLRKFSQDYRFWSDLKWQSAKKTSWKPLLA